MKTIDMALENDSLFRIRLYQVHLGTGVKPTHIFNCDRYRLHMQI
jgi:hypothetical protein